MVRHVVIQMPPIEFAVISCACSTSAGSAYALIIQLLRALVLLAALAKGTTVGSSAEKHVIETHQTALPPETDAITVRNGAAATVIGIDCQRGIHRDVLHAITAVHNATVQAVVSQDQRPPAAINSTNSIEVAKTIIPIRILHRAFLFNLP